MDIASLRGVSNELGKLTSAGSALHRNSSHATYFPNVPASPDRIVVQRRLLDEFLAAGDGDIAKDGLAAVVMTAGPPGAGKSTQV